MNMKLKQIAESQLESLIQEYQDISSREKFPDSSCLSDGEYHRFTSRAYSAILRIAGVNSAYIQEANRIKERNKSSCEYLNVTGLHGILWGLYEDIKAGHMDSFTELIHGEVFSDFIEMAAHFIDNGYKDAAAVVAGSSLEAHLRVLCQKNGIDVDTTLPSGDIQRKKADLLNSELTKAGVYEKLDQKSVTAWLDLRNKAAHGNYSDYTKEQVQLMISCIRDFLTRNPA